ncbi:hypothetical protein GOBAR_AA04436 [Gossypium barbadense]|uniref:Uncharacterized protein n=1 Tax=Gossypium barbadense TaxID=3634 RepID=A0A2P5YKL4_GOSBA|nr:hypothetical protein GOBAR_AA04436 [Gossypium barbadense]
MDSREKLRKRQNTDWFCQKLISIPHWKGKIKSSGAYLCVLKFEGDRIKSLVDEPRLCDLSVITGLVTLILVPLRPQRIVLGMSSAARKVTQLSDRLTKPFCFLRLGDYSCHFSSFSRNAPTFVSLSSKETGFQVWLMNHEFGAVMPCWFTYTEEDRSQLILSGWDGHTVVGQTIPLCPVEQNLGDYSITASEIVEGQSAKRPAT